ncbi:LLR1-like protein [Mya arenaria]|uniref:LLR1-like protein n=1 Tax=Mya arenaria TaxID=6604 RepID=A0ABY7FBU2_MYAAR|nr:LLR1-like protein [Mya arenaria]
MRLTCDVEVLDRMLATANLRKASKPVRAQMAIGRSSPSNNVYMMICTTKDKSGSEQFGQSFHKADVIQLKSFLNVLRQVVQGKTLDKTVFSVLAPVTTKKIERPKTVMVITTKKNYPLTTNFPSTLETLQVNDCNMRRIDSRIFQLRNLVSLDLSDNSLNDVLDGIGSLQMLAELILKNNKFQKFPVTICKLKTLQKSLSLLDLSDNQIRQLPVQICELTNLMTLKADNNVIEQIPPTIGRLQNLKSVSLAGNKLTVLPAGFMRLRLENVDLYGNSFIITENETTADSVDVPTLLECAARYVRKYRLPYSEEDLHPHLCRYLDSARVCWCGSFCFQGSVGYTRMVDLRAVTSAITAVDTTGRTAVPVQGYLCSPQCLNKFKTDPNAYWK